MAREDRDARYTSEAGTGAGDIRDTQVLSTLAVEDAQRVETEAETDTSPAAGLKAIRAVRAAAKRRADAQQDLREIERGLEEDEAELIHRQDIEDHYDEIVATETEISATARQEVQEATAKIREAQREQARLTDTLKRTRERNEQKLRPYRNLADSSRGRSDDAAKALAAARRDLKAAERAMAEATKTRDARISAAHRDVDNASERLSAVEAEAEQTRQAGDEVALERVAAELESERAHLSTARAEVDRVSAEERDHVDQIQRNLLKRQRDLTSAEQAAEAAKTEATQRKTEYDNLYKEAQTEERVHEDAIKSQEESIKELKRTRAAAQKRYEESQATLEEANQIHDHPEVTEGLRLRIDDEQADLDEARAELDRLVKTETTLRQRTRGTRLFFIIVATLVVASVIALIVWFLTR